MPYYIRVLGERNKSFDVEEMQKWIRTERILDVSLEVESQDETGWSKIIAKRSPQEALFVIERNPVEPGSLGESEIQEFIDEVRIGHPKSAAQWLEQFLVSVRVVFAFQILFATQSDADWAVLHLIHTKIWNEVGGILQADGEGFSNLDGYHILWQFSDDVSGLWNMAILNDVGNWVTFEMDLADDRQRKAFLAGKIP